MTDFYAKRREPLLNEQPSQQQKQLLTHRISRDALSLETKLNQEGVRSDAWAAWHSSIARNTWSLMVLNYSEGESIGQVAATLPNVINALENCVLPNAKYETRLFFLEEKDSYAWFLALLTFAKLLHHDQYVSRIVGVLDVAYKDNRGKDQLYEALIKKLGLPSVETKNSLSSFTCSALLFDVTQAGSNNRPKLMQKFLKKWYSAMKGVVWYNTHKKNPTAFRGYWCWEAALVTYLWDIDDASYRDMPYYPKDLIDWARQHT